MTFLLGYLLIFFAKIADVTLCVVRTILTVRGKKVQAALIGVVEIVIYIVALTKIMSQLDNIGNLVAYALGFGSGQIIGIWVEQKMAIGNLMVQIIPKGNAEELVHILRNEGFGVTVIQGYGRNGIRHVLHIAMQRNMLSKLNKILDEYDKDAFITIMDTRHIQGGYLQKFKRK